MKVRDKLWLFCSRAHDDDVWLGKSFENRFTRWSRITPAEGAAMLDVPNVIMVGSDGVPAPYFAEAYGYMELQCEYGLSLLKEKRIEGIIFLTNCVMGVGLPSEYWLREWIDKVKEIEV